MGQKKVRKKSLLREYVEAIGLAVILALIIRTFVVQAFKIPSGSMIPTLLIGDHILVCKFYYWFNEPERGDILVFRYPQDRDRDFIKRVIGLPGDKVVIRGNRVYVNGTPIDEPYAVYYGRNGKRDLVKKNFQTVVPPDSYFVLGDNRNRSLDSRYWGFLPQNLILGKAWILYWSWDPSKDLPLWKKVRWKRITQVIH